MQQSFGDEWDRLAKDYCWMPDWREAVRPDYYADDYLLFPGTPSHFSHLPPEVRRSYEPFFRRALQALRTENPQNAARWIGSLLHFVQDSGSPPHAANIVGETHARMERWVDESKIQIAGYPPKLLGKTDDEALKSFLERMAELEAFAKARGDKLKPIVEKLKDRENQPLELDCALECARVSADVMHTLFTLAARSPGQGAGLHGKIECSSPADYAKVPVKLMLSGTRFSTTADREGRFEFRNLPAGKYDIWLMATGCEAELVRGVELQAGKEVRLDRKLRGDPVAGNLIRNPAFQIQWLRANEPDCWYADPVRKGRWASTLIRVPVDRRCDLHVEFRVKEVPVSIRWRTDPSKPEGKEIKLESAMKAEISPDPLLKPFEQGFVFLEVLIDTGKPLSEVCKRVSVQFAPK